MRKRVLSKKAAQRAHARRRARERYGVSLTKPSFHAIVQQIQNGKATFLGRTSLRVTEWIVPFEGAKLRVVYDRKRKTIVTCLP
jgi:hypothetical protein